MATLWYQHNRTFTKIKSGNLSHVTSHLNVTLTSSVTWFVLMLWYLKSAGQVGLGSILTDPLSLWGHVFWPTPPSVHHITICHFSCCEATVLTTELPYRQHKGVTDKNLTLLCSFWFPHEAIPENGHKLSPRP